MTNSKPNLPKTPGTGRPRRARRQPNAFFLYRLGRKIGEKIGYSASLEEIAATFGFKDAYEANYFCNVALGKLVYRLRHRLKVK